MKVVLISDTHLRHVRGPIDVPPGDVLVHAGDALLSGDLDELGHFARWLDSLPHAHKVFVPGNHDGIFEDAPSIARAALPPEVVCLIDQEATVAGLRIYGSPWQPAFQDWAFNLPRGLQLAEKWDRIPGGLDILVTHGPPAGILDGARSERLGCQDLLEAVERTQPRVHVFGHIHPGYGAKQVGATLFVNASVCDPAYRAVNRPIVLEMDRSRLEVAQAPGAARWAEGPMVRGASLWGD